MYITALEYLLTMNYSTRGFSYPSKIIQTDRNGYYYSREGKVCRIGLNHTCPVIPELNLNSSAVNFSNPPA